MRTIAIGVLLLLLVVAQLATPIDVPVDRQVDDGVRVVDVNRDRRSIPLDRPTPPSDFYDESFVDSGTTSLHEVNNDVVGESEGDSEDDGDDDTSASKPSASQATESQSDRRSSDDTSRRSPGTLRVKELRKELAAAAAYIRCPTEANSGYSSMLVSGAVVHDGDVLRSLESRVKETMMRMGRRLYDAERNGKSAVSINLKAKESLMRFAEAAGSTTP